MSRQKTTFFPGPEKYINRALEASANLDRERIFLLDQLVEFMRSTLSEQSGVNLVFICTHNSRRSHFAQIWAHVMSRYFQLPVRSFSGGTEATAVNYRVVKTLDDIGFSIYDPGGENPKYRFRFGDNHDPLEAWSKSYDDPSNPHTGFCAVMTCSDADQNCPVVTGAAKRVPLHYRDPKESDDTPDEQTTYQERCFQIASEIAYVMQQIADSAHLR